MVSRVRIQQTVPHHSVSFLGIRQVLWYLVVCPSLLHLFGASALQALAPDIPTWHPAQRKQRQRTQRALREHTDLSGVRLEFAKRLLRSYHGSIVLLLAHAAGQHNGKEKFAGTDRIMCDSVVLKCHWPEHNFEQRAQGKDHTCNWPWTQDPKCSRLLKTAFVYPVRKLWCACRVTSVLSKPKFHATHHKTVTGVVSICFAARWVICDTATFVRRNFMLLLWCLELTTLPRQTSDRHWRCAALSV